MFVKRNEFLCRKMAAVLEDNDSYPRERTVEACEMVQSRRAKTEAGGEGHRKTEWIDLSIVANSDKERGRFVCSVAVIMEVLS